MSMMLDSTEMDKLSYEIFSVLENRFLFGAGFDSSSPQTPIKAAHKSSIENGKIRILSIDANGDLLAAVALSRIESSLRSHDPNARIVDFFDVAAGSGTGGVLAAMLFSKGPDGRPLYSAEEAVRFLARNQRGLVRKSRGLKGIFQKPNGIFGRIFGQSTLRDTLKPVLIPCYDLSSRAPFLFSRADAVETDSYDFKMIAVCAATCADRTVEMRSIDRKTRIAAVGGGAAMRNPTAAAITHVLNNKQEFPFANSVEDLVVISLGGGGSDSVRFNGRPSRTDILRIAGNDAADTVDHAVAMAFGHSMTSNYVRIQANGFFTKESKARSSSDLASKAEKMLSHRNVESVLFQGKKISEHSNVQKLENFSHQLIKERERRKSRPIPMVLIKQAMTPRSSSATNSTTFTVSTTTASP